MPNYQDANLNSLIQIHRPKGITAVNKLDAIVGQYQGPTAGGWLTVAAGGDLTFEKTDTSTADTDVNTTGVIDLSTPAAGFDTMIELVNFVNLTSYWRFLLLGAKGGLSTDNTLAAVTDQAAKVAKGVGLPIDEGITPFTSGFSITNRGFNGVGTVKTDQGMLNSLDYLAIHLTSVGGITINIYEVEDGDDSAPYATNVVETLLATFAVASATAFEKQFATVWGGGVGRGITAGIGKRLFVELVGAAAVSMPTPTGAASYIWARGTTMKVG